MKTNVTPPTPLVARWMKYVIGFGVSVGIGLLPYLGKINVPGFVPLLRLIPESIQDTAIPLSAALMGMVAVWVEWEGSNRVSPRWLRRRFASLFAISLLAFGALFVVHTLVVARVDFLGGTEYSRFLVGFSRPNRQPCTEDVSDSECIKRISASTSAIESFWGDRRIREAKLALIGSYLWFTSCFGFLTGLLVLQRERNVHK